MRHRKIHLQTQVHWQDVSRWGKANKMRDFPRPERVKVRKALARVRYPYKEIAAFINPYHLGGRMQWLDFVVWVPYKHHMGVILFEWGSKSYSFKRGLEGFAVKKRFLEEKEIPVLVLPRFYSTDEYEIMIIRWAKSIARREAVGEQP